MIQRWFLYQGACAINQMWQKVDKLPTTFKCVLCFTNSIQIHNFAHHWVTSYRAAHEDVVFVYDSLLNLNNRQQPIVAVDLQRQLRQMYSVRNTLLTVGFPTTTRQTNAMDCGVLAVAFAVDLCCNRKPEEHEFDVSLMRRHICNMFAQGTVMAFPYVRSRAGDVLYVDI